MIITDPEDEIPQGVTINILCERVVKDGRAIPLPPLIVKEEGDDHPDTARQHLSTPTHARPQARTLMRAPRTKGGPTRYLTSSSVRGGMGRYRHVRMSS